MTDFPMLREALAPLLEWTRNEALPFWGTVGIDHTRAAAFTRDSTCKGDQCLTCQSD